MRRHVRTCLLAAVVAAAGCTRGHFRDRADRDVEGVLTQKNIFPDWHLDESWHVYPDAAARYADPACPDKPPYPPDDYAAALTSPNPQKPPKGVGSGRYEGTGYLARIAEWDALNRTDAEDTLSPPTEARRGPPELHSDEKLFRLKLEQAIELAQFNSREFQDRREDLYLAAIPVTQERFSFAAQALSTETAVRQSSGRDLVDAGNRWNIGTDTTVTRLFPTGAALLVRFANQAVLDLSSGRPDLTVSQLTFSFLQPLLRGGGYAVTLEALTQAERSLVYAMRSYARFRKNFYVAVAGNGDYTNNPYGLQGLSANLGRGIGNNLTAPRAGFLPTLLRSATLANERKNITSLEQFLKLYNNLKEGGGVNELQSVRVEQQLLRSRTTLLTNTRLYADQLDNFKLQLGVPTTLPLELDDEYLRPMRKQVQRYEEVFEQLRQLQDSAGKFDPAETPAQLRERWKQLLTTSPLAKGTALAKEFPERVAELRALSPEALLAQIKERALAREKFLDARAARQLAGKDETDANTLELDAIDARIDVLRFEQAFRAYEALPWLRVPPERRVTEQSAAFRGVTDGGLLVAIRARNQRLENIRAEWPKVPAFRIDGTDVLELSLDDASTRAAQAALTNRLDLMNARGQVVDAYRQIAVRANALQGQLDVGYNLNTATPPADNEPLAFAGSRTRHQLTLRFDPPLVRRLERNLYRAALISYQRQRRTLMAFEDNILVDCRSDLRQLRAAAGTYKLQRRAVELAYAQVDNARSTLLAPPDPTARDSAGNVAALTQQLLEAQSSLLQAQNDLFTAWVNYLTIRMELALDLELLPLDARGVWTDDATLAEPAARPPSP